MFGGHSNIEPEKSPTPAKPGRKFFEKSDLGYASFFRNERLVFRGANISFCGLYKFRNVKRGFLVEDNLRAADGECQDAERRIAFQHPIIAQIRAQLFPWLINSHLLMDQETSAIMPVAYHLASFACIDKFLQTAVKQFRL